MTTLILRNLSFALGTLLLLFLQQQSSLGSNVGFMKSFGGPGDDYAFSMRQTSDKGFIIAGFTSSFGQGGEDLLLIKLDATGTLQWSRAAGGTGTDKGYAVREAPDGGYIVTGDSDSFTGMGQILTAKFDALGAFQWACTVGVQQHSAAGLAIDVTSDSGCIVTGFPIGALGGIALLKYDEMGEVQWLRHALGINHYGQSVIQTSDGGYVVAGSKQGNVYDLSLLKFDGSGNLLWAQLAGGADLDYANWVQQTVDGGYIVAGQTASFGAGGDDLLLLKYDGSGFLQWARTVGGDGHDSGHRVEQTSDGGYVVVGQTGSFDKGGTVTFLVKFNSSGTLEWARAGGGSASLSSVEQLGDGGFLMVGTTPGFGEGSADVLLIRTDENGNIDGCDHWSPVWPTVGMTCPSSPASHSVQDLDPSYAGVGSLTVNNISLVSHIQCVATLQVQIDIKPGSYPNSINLGSSGTVPVAVLSCASFDATTVNPTLTTLASAPVQMKGKGTPMCSFEDIDGDNLVDLVVHVSTEALQLSATDVEAVLEGETFQGVRIRGVDTVRVVP